MEDDDDKEMIEEQSVGEERKDYDSTGSAGSGGPRSFSTPQFARVRYLSDLHQQVWFARQRQRRQNLVECLDGMKKPCEPKFQ